MNSVCVNEFSVIIFSKGTLLKKRLPLVIVVSFLIAIIHKRLPLVIVASFLIAVMYKILEDFKYIRLFREKYLKQLQLMSEF